MKPTPVIVVTLAGCLALFVANPSPGVAGQYPKHASNPQSDAGDPAGQARAAGGLTVLASASPGANSAYVQASGDLPTGPFSFGCFSSTPTLSVQIKRGKAKSVVNVTAFAAFQFIATTGAKGTLFAYADVNGVVTPLPFGASADCLSVFGESTTCTITDTEWFDLDALEQQFPGQFKGRPLSINLWACVATDDTSILSTGEASMSAIMQKK